MDFPLLDYGKRDMRALAEQGRYLAILEKSWFCHYPIGDAACGRCSPCVQVMKAGMAYRLPRRARLRYAVSIERRIREWRREHDPETAA
jgi:7-cyano-7-deazaguanine synthase